MGIDTRVAGTFCVLALLALCSMNPVSVYSAGDETPDQKVAEVLVPPAQSNTRTQPNTIDTDYAPYESEMRFATAVGEVVLLEFIPWATARWISKAEWAKVSTNDWWDHIERGWTYDGDNFVTNQFAHPYHGNLFFNAARTNGYDFWESAPFVMSGSLVWEFFGENTFPSINDWASTTLSGINIGESLYRISNVITDNTATGTERVLREIAGTLINPVRGFNRLLSGETAKVFPNPADRLPGSSFIDLTFGARTFDEDGFKIVDERERQAIVSVSYNYGNPFDGDIKKPFAHFQTGVSIASADQTLTSFYSRGILHGWDVSKSKNSHHVLGIFHAFDYWANPAFDMGATALSSSLLSSFRLSEDWSISSSISVGGTIMAATPTEFFIDPEGRDYDFGPGISTNLHAGLNYNDWQIVRLALTAGWIWSFSGSVDAKHNIQVPVLQLKVPLSDVFAIGLRVAAFRRTSSYPNFEDTNQESSISELFLAVKLH